MSEKSKKIKSKLFIEGKIHTLTGLHIGGNSGGLRIGGVDSAVVRSALSNEPYIPGSSLRGKMRSLLERARGPESQNSEEGGYSDKGQAGNKSNTLLGKLFGTSADQNKEEPTRLIVRDTHLTSKSAKELKNASNTDMPMTEVKTEVSIHRITSAANPREFERVPAGAVFDVKMILTLFEYVKSDDRAKDKCDDEPKKFLNLIFEAFALIEGDSLGGHGSRGYGKVCFREFKVFEKTAEDYKKSEERKSFEPKIPYEIPDEFKKKLEEELEKETG